MSLNWRVNEILAFQQEELTVTKGPTASEQRAAVVNEMRMQRVAMERLASAQEKLARSPSGSAPSGSARAGAPSPAPGFGWLWASEEGDPRLTA